MSMSIRIVITIMIILMMMIMLSGILEMLSNLPPSRQKVFHRFCHCLQFFYQRFNNFHILSLLSSFASQIFTCHIILCCRPYLFLSFFLAKTSYFVITVIKDFVLSQHSSSSSLSPSVGDPWKRDPKSVPPPLPLPLRRLDHLKLKP